MRTLLAIALVPALSAVEGLAQDKPPQEIEAILRDFGDKMRRARSPDEIRTHARAAMEKLDAMAKDGPNAALASYHAGEMGMFQEEPGVALARFKQAFEKGLPKSLLPNARYLLGEISIQEDDFAGARTWLGEFARNHPEDERLFQARVLAELTHFMEGKPDAGAAGLAKLREEYKGKDQEWNVVGAAAAAHHFAGQNDRMRAALEETAGACPNVAMAENAKRTLAAMLCLGREAKLAAKDADGKEVDLAKLRGRVVIVHFYTMGWQRAPAETVAIRRTLKACEGKDVSAVSVSIDRRKEDVERFRRDLLVTWPVVHDGNGFAGPAAEQFGVRDLPYMVIVDRKGAIRFLNPVLTMAVTEIKVLVERLLAEK